MRGRLNLSLFRHAQWSETDSGQIIVKPEFFETGRV
jgi:hypothetical protein